MEEAHYFLGVRIAPYYPQLESCPNRFVSFHVNLSLREAVTTVGTLQVDETFNGEIDRNFKLFLLNTQLLKAKLPARRGKASGSNNDIKIIGFPTFLQD